MIRKSFIFILLTASAYSLTLAQTPEAKKNVEKALGGYAWTIDGGGSYLGIETEEVSKENFAKFGLREVRGVAVEKVIDGSPAQAAGLQGGDVIVKFNGEEITSMRKLTRLIGEVAPDHQAKLTVLRSGSEREISATLAKRPTPKFAEGSFSMMVPGQPSRMRIPSMPDMPEIPPMAEMPLVQSFPPMGEGSRDFFAFSGRSNRHIGIGVSPLTKQLSEHFGVTGGVMINNVRENSPAAKAGLKAGDIIVEADGKELKGEVDLIRAIGAKKEGSVNLTIVRDRNRQTISVTPEEVKGGFNMFFEGQDGEGFAPGQFKMLRPGTPPAPVQLNHLLFPGRIL